MKFLKKIVINVTVDRTWSTTWNGLRWTAVVHYEKCLFGIIKWDEKCQIAGPFDNKQDAKRVAKHLRKKYNLK